MKKVLFLLLLITGFVNAQSYKSALGLRLNHFEGAVTYKWFMTGTEAIDLTLSTGFNDNGFALTGLYELHTPTSLTPELQWYYGLGGFVSMYGNSAVSTFGFGVAGVLGVEYTIPEIPFAISLDYIPSLGIQTINYKDDTLEDDIDLFTGFQGWTLGIKYTFGSYVHKGEEN